MTSCVIPCSMPRSRRLSRQRQQGIWYSGYSGTPEAGYGKTWTVAEVVKRVSKTCSDTAINEAVERAGFSSGCFSKCGPHATGSSRNTSDPCWITCFEDTEDTAAASAVT